MHGGRAWQLAAGAVLGGTTATFGLPLTPLFWEELTPDLRPDQFTVRNLSRRLLELAEDPFGRMPRLRQKLLVYMARE